MAYDMISDLAAVTTPAGTDLLEIEQGGVSYKATAAQITGGVIVKKLTGTTGAAEGNVTTIAHGLNSAKILSVNAIVEYSTGSYVGVAYSHSPGYFFSMEATATNINIANHPTDSENILSKPVRILVWYEL